MSRKQGQHYEDIAAEYLVKQGLKLLTRNYQVYRGELDLVLLDKKILVFAEVKYRKNSRFGSAAEMVNWKKQQHLAFAANTFLKMHPAYLNNSCRFDVLAMSGNSEDPKIDWIKNAFLIT
ncbi:MAG: YraN family protein [Gammaproteobacteria bacterium]|jgi:putative endonuclease